MDGDERRERDEGKRKSYRAPRLVEYGDVRKLTQSGGSGSSDFGGPGVMALTHGGGIGQDMG
jgi:hypothetical protein